MRSTKKVLSRSFMNIIYKILTLLIIWGSTFSVFILLMVAHDHSSLFLFNFAQEIAINWKTNPIIDITVSSTPCAPDFQEAFRYTWPGIMEGCFCKGINEKDRFEHQINCEPSHVCPNTCTNIQKKLGCKNITPLKPKEFEHWGIVGTNPQRVCIKRAQENWFDISQLSASDCPAGYKKCGSASNKSFCIKGNTCPITHLKIAKISPQEASSCKAPDCFIIHNLTNTIKKLEIHRGDDSRLPIVELRINEYGMCYNKDEINITPLRRDYPLLLKKRTNCHLYGSKFWDVIDEITEEEFFIVNNHTNIMSLLKGTGYYSEVFNASDYKWKFFSTNYIYLDPSCRPQMENIVTSTEWKSIQILSFFLISLCLFSLAIAYSAIEIHGLLGSPKSKKFKRNLRRARWCIQLAVTLLIIHTIWKISNTKQLFDTLEQKDCFEPDVAKLIRSDNFLLSSILNNNQYSLIVIIISLLAGLLLDFLMKRNPSRKWTRIKSDYDEKRKFSRERESDSDG